MEFAPIGFFHGTASYKFEAPRQGVFQGGTGQVILEPGHNFEMALRDLAGFERIWLIFAFDRNGSAWRPTARPPVAAAGRERVGLFASRAPYRPNPIGLSCVRLVNVSGRRVDVDEADLLDGTPILDIKPYVPAVDAFPDARAGWVEAQVHDDWTIKVSRDFINAAAFVQKAAAPEMVRAAGAEDLIALACVQLGESPFDASRKRVVRTATGGVLSVRMFRLHFTADVGRHEIILTRLTSGYTSEELASPNDPYGDKSLHRTVVSWLTQMKCSE